MTADQIHAHRLDGRTWQEIARLAGELVSTVYRRYQRDRQRRGLPTAGRTYDVDPVDIPRVGPRLTMTADQIHAHRLDGRTWQEIARLAGEPRSTIYGRYQRDRQRRGLPTAGRTYTVEPIDIPRVRRLRACGLSWSEIARMTGHTRARLRRLRRIVGSVTRANGGPSISDR